MLMKNAEPVVLLSSSHVRPQLLLNILDRQQNISDLVIDRHVAKKWGGCRPFKFTPPSLRAAASARRVGGEQAPGAGNRASAPFRFQIGNLQGLDQP